VTFLMVFLIQRSQNKEMLGMQIKLNELIKACANARDEVIAIEKEAEAKLRAEYSKQKGGAD
jgi:low affinity Fe/Cu permease